jgi:hypothetical protein
MKIKRKKFGKAPPYIALVETLNYMDEFYIPPSLDKTLKLAFKACIDHSFASM